MDFRHNLYFLFALTLSISFTAMKADLVDDICAKTLNPATCSQLIRTDPRSNTSDILALGYIAIDVGSTQAESGKSVVKSLLGGATDPKLRRIYLSCLANYEDSAHDVDQLARLLKFRDYGSLRSNASAASDEAVACDGKFSGGSFEPPQLKDASVKMQTICSAVLVITDELLGS